MENSKLGLSKWIVFGISTGIAAVSHAGSFHALEESTRAIKKLAESNKTPVVLTKTVTRTKPANAFGERRVPARQGGASSESFDGELGTKVRLVSPSDLAGITDDANNLQVYRRGKELLFRSPHVDEGVSVRLASAHFGQPAENHVLILDRANLPQKPSPDGVSASIPNRQLNLTYQADPQLLTKLDSSGTLLMHRSKSTYARLIPESVQRGERIYQLGYSVNNAGTNDMKFLSLKVTGDLKPQVIEFLPEADARTGSFRITDVSGATHKISLTDAQVNFTGQDTMGQKVLAVGSHDGIFLIGEMAEKARTTQHFTRSVRRGNAEAAAARQQLARLFGDSSGTSSVGAGNSAIVSGSR